MLGVVVPVEHPAALPQAVAVVLPAGDGGVVVGESGGRADRDAEQQGVRGDHRLPRGPRRRRALAPVLSSMSWLRSPAGAPQESVPGVGAVGPGCVGWARGPPSAAVFTASQGRPSASPWTGPSSRSSCARSGGSGDDLAGLDETDPRAGVDDVEGLLQVLGGQAACGPLGLGIPEARLRPVQVRGPPTRPSALHWAWPCRGRRRVRW